MFAVSTFCRNCGSHLNLKKGRVLSTRKIQGPKVRDTSDEDLWEEPKEEISKPVPAAIATIQEEEPPAPSGPMREVECFDCGKRHHVAAAASSSFCPACAAYISLKDEEIVMPRRINLRTRGNITIQKKGSLIGSKIACNNLKVYGQIAGSVDCQGEVIFKTQGKVLGELRCKKFVLEKKSSVQFLQPIYAESIEIYGELEGDVVCEGALIVQDRGSIMGTIKARSVVVGKDSCLKGTVDINDSITRPPKEYTENLFGKSEEEDEDERVERNLFGGTSVASHA